MKLTDDLWDEWLATPITDRVSARSELSGLASSLEVEVRGGQASLMTNRYWVPHRFKRLLAKTRFCDEEVSLQAQGSKRALILSLDLYHSLTNVADEQAFIALAWARGLWGGCGSLYTPKAGYYCLWRPKSPVVASRLAEVMSGLGLRYAVRQKGSASEIILRDLNDIIALCGYLKLPEAENRLQELGMARHTRNLANRQTNSDASNIKRAVGAAARQGHLARWAKEHLPLSEHMAHLVEVRLNNPGANLAELGELLTPPRSKSAVKYHWDKLLLWAESEGYKRPDEGLELGGSDGKDESCD